VPLRIVLACPATLKRWLGERDALFLIDRCGEPLVLVRWSAWQRLVDTRVA